MWLALSFIEPSIRVVQTAPTGPRLTDTASSDGRQPAVASRTLGLPIERNTPRLTTTALPSTVLRCSAICMQVEGAKDLSAEELEVALLTEEKLLIDVYATWCGPCKLLSPEVDTLARVLAGKVRVVKFDSEQEPGGPELATSLAVGGLPTLLFVSEGEVMHRLEGALSASRIAELVEGVWFGAEMPRGPEYGDFSGA